MTDTIIYNEQFETGVEEMLKNHDYWVYATQIHPSQYIRRPNELSEVLKRVQKDDKYNGLRITRLEGDTDVGNPQLNPRTELVPGFRVPYRERYHVHIEVYFDDSILNSTFLQIMGKDNNNKTKPLITLDTRAGNMNVRTHDFNQNPDGYFQRHRVANYQEDLYKKTVAYDLFIYPDTSSGYFKVYMNNRLVFELENKPTYWSRGNGQIQLQYGCYGTDGTKNFESLVYQRLYFAKHNTNTFVPLQRQQPIPDPEPTPEPTPEPPPTDTLPEKSIVVLHQQDIEFMYFKDDAWVFHLKPSF